MEVISNKKFWDRRYRECPELGSGPGSRGFVISRKRKLVKSAMELLSARSVLDIGCGDLCWLDRDIVNKYFYKGLDISPVVIEANKHSWPTVDFEVFDIVADSLCYSVDLVVSFDVLIHQTKLDNFLSALKNTLQAAKHGALISYKKSPEELSKLNSSEILDTSEIALENDFKILKNKIQKSNSMPAIWHGELSEFISSLYPDAITSKIDQYRSQNVYMVTNLKA